MLARADRDRGDAGGAGELGVVAEASAPAISPTSLAAVRGPKPGSVSRCGATWATRSAISASSALIGVGQLAQAAQLVAGDPDAHRLLGAREAPGDAACVHFLREQRAAGERELGPEIVQIPLQRVVERDARANQALAMIDEQPDVELRARQRRRRQRLDPGRQRGARDGDRVDADRTCRARGWSGASPAISRVETRTTRSPRAIRNRSSAPETCRQSSSAQTRSPSRPRAQISSAANPRAPTGTVLSPSSCAGRRVDRRDRVRALVGVRPEHDHDPRPPPFRCGCWTPGGHGLLGALPRSYQVTPRHPRPATSDTTKGSQATPADSLKESQLAARSGPSPRRRTSPTHRIETASLEGTLAVLPSALLVVVRSGSLPSLGRCDGGRCPWAVFASVGPEDRRRRPEALEGAVDAEEEFPQELRDGRDALQ